MWILKEEERESQLAKNRINIQVQSGDNAKHFPLMELGTSTKIFRNNSLTEVRPTTAQNTFRNNPLTAMTPPISWSILYQDQHYSGSKILFS